MFMVFCIRNPGGYLFITSIFPKPAQVGILWGLGLPVHFLISLAAWACLYPLSFFLIHFSYINVFILRELRYELI
jgi:hypothetical protein